MPLFNIPHRGYMCYILLKIIMAQGVLIEVLLILFLLETCINILASSVIVIKVTFSQYSTL